MIRRRIIVMLSCAVLVVFIANSIALASNLTDQSLDLEKSLPDQASIVNMKESDSDTNSTMEGQGVDASSSSIIVCATSAKLNRSGSNLYYYGKITSSPAAQKLTIRADLQYKSPVAMYFEDEVSNYTVTGYNTSSLETPTYIYSCSWGYWRCKAVGSYTDSRYNPSFQSNIDYSNTIYYEP